MTPTTPTGMDAVVTALTTQLTADKFFTVVAQLVPLIALLVPVALAIYFLRKLVKGAGKGKVRFQPIGFGYFPRNRKIVMEIFMLEYFQELFVQTSVHLIDLIIPVLGIWLLFDLITGLLFKEK